MCKIKNTPELSKDKTAPILYWTMEGLLKQMFDKLFKLHGSFKMFKSLLLKEDGDWCFPNVNW